MNFIVIYKEKDDFLFFLVNLLKAINPYEQALNYPFSVSLR